MEQHTSAEESEQSFRDQFDEVVKSDSWLTVAWTFDGYDENGSPIITVRKTTNSFDMVHYMQALFSLKAMMDQEIEAKLAERKREPLPLAPHLQVKDLADITQIDDDLKTSQQASFDQGRFPGSLKKNESNNEKEKNTNEDDKSNESDVSVD